MLKNDRWINEQAAHGLLEPFQATLVRHLEPENRSKPVLSFGCSSYVYDLRLSPSHFKKSFCRSHINTLITVPSECTINYKRIK